MAFYKIQYVSTNEKRTSGTSLSEAKSVIQPSATPLVPQGVPPNAMSNRYSTVTLLARFRGLSTSQPRATAM